MKTRFKSMMAFVVSALLLSTCYTYAQSYGYDDDYGQSNRYSNQNVTVQAENSDISYNLDLRAVANLFADSRDLEEFERRLNDYDTGINNLDLNRDGQVDYLRVIETAKGNTHLVVLQAVVGYDMFQDVASIVVERKNNSRHQVQIIGDPYLYGPYYIIEPVYVYVPPIFSFFWGPRYHRWHSPYYWGYYPSYWHHWSPYSTHVYINNVNIYVDKSRHTYKYSDRITNNNYSEMRRGVSRSDYQRSNPDRSFSSRNATRSNVNNRKDLDNIRASSRNSTTLTNRNSSTTGASTNRGNAVNSTRDTRSADVNSRSTQTRSSSNVTRNSGAVRSAEQWNATRNNNNRSNQTRSEATTRSSSTQSRGSLNQPSRSSSSSTSRGTAVTPRSNSSTSVTPSRSSSSRSSGTVTSPSRSSSSRSTGTVTTPSRSSSSSSGNLGGSSRSSGGSRR